MLNHSTRTLPLYDLSDREQIICYAQLLLVSKELNGHDGGRLVYGSSPFSWTDVRRMSEDDISNENLPLLLSRLFFLFLDSVVYIIRVRVYIKDTSSAQCIICDQSLHMKRLMLGFPLFLTSNTIGSPFMSSDFFVLLFHLFDCFFPSVPLRLSKLLI